MARNKTVLTFTDNSAEVERIIKENPQKAFATIAKTVITESKIEVPVRTGKLKKSIDYWLKKNRDTGDMELQIGFLTTKKPKGTSYSHLVFPDPTTNPITKSVFRNKETIARLVKDSIEPYLKTKQK